MDNKLFDRAKKAAQKHVHIALGSGRIGGIGSRGTKGTCHGGVKTFSYHGTDVVRFNPHGVELRTGGWHTLTTKRRMNQVSSAYGLGFNVSQRKGIWYVAHKGKEHKFWEGMRLQR